MSVGSDMIKTETGGMDVLYLTTPLQMCALQTWGRGGHGVEG